MRWDQIRILHELAYRQLAGRVRQSLERPADRVALAVIAFLLTFTVLLFNGIFPDERFDPNAGFARFGRAVFGLLALSMAGMLLGLPMSLAQGAGTPLGLGPQGEDILLPLPISSRTLGQAILLERLYLAVALAGTLSVLAVGIESRLFLVDVPVRFAFTFLTSVSLFAAPVAGGHILRGAQSGNPTVGRAMEAVAAAIMVVVIAWVVYVLSQGPQAAVAAFANHPLTKGLIETGVLVAVAFTGTHAEPAAMMAVIVLGVVALLAVLSGLGFPYRLYEGEVSPYAPQQGRGFERESPPTPGWLERLEKRFHVDYFDRGPGVLGVSGLAWTTGLRTVSPVFPLSVPLLLFLGNILWGDFLSRDIHLAMLVPIAVLGLWVFGHTGGAIVALQLQPRVLTSLPGPGKRVFWHAFLPVPAIGLLTYYAALVPALLLPGDLLLKVLEGLVVAPGMLFIGYIHGAASTVMGSETWEHMGAPRSAEERWAQPPPSFTGGVWIVPVLVLWGILLALVPGAQWPVVGLAVAAIAAGVISLITLRATRAAQQWLTVPLPRYAAR